MTRQRRAARGQVVVMFGLGLVVILLIVGLVVDGGKAFFERRSGQNDADVAALAGTKVVADGYTLTGGATRGMAYAEIQRSIIANGCLAGGTEPCTWSASFVGQGQRPIGPVNAGDSAGFTGSGILGVRVDVRRSPRTYFLGLIGRSSWVVETSATALAAKPDKAPASQVLPIGLHEPTTRSRPARSTTSPPTRERRAGSSGCRGRPSTTPRRSARASAGRTTRRSPSARRSGPVRSPSIRPTSRA